jgi:RHS repeat-associated protein
MRVYFHDGWNLIAESLVDKVVDPQNNLEFHWEESLDFIYTWGLDLSQSLQGAGGVGGLLVAEKLSDGNTGRYYPTYDGNGNISEYLALDGEDVVAVAHYEYDPFGNLLSRSAGTLIDLFKFRFSTKYHDAETGLYYYGYRWYDPLTGRWPSRDSIEEEGGVNLYGFASNDAVDHIDLLGRTIGVGYGSVDVGIGRWPLLTRPSVLDNLFHGLFAQDLTPWFDQQMSSLVERVQKRAVGSIDGYLHGICDWESYPSHFDLPNNYKEEIVPNSLLGYPADWYHEFLALGRFTFWWRHVNLDYRQFDEDCETGCFGRLRWNGSFDVIDTVGFQPRDGEIFWLLGWNIATSRNIRKAHWALSGEIELPCNCFD